MKNIISTICLSIFVMASTPAWADVYGCSILEIRALSDAGRLHKTARAKDKEESDYKVIWNEESRSMEIGFKGGGKPEVKLFDIIQAGTDQNATTAVHIFKGTASTFTSLFRLHTYTDELPFMLTGFSEVWTGNCERL